jgi:hypothetical protein
MKKVFLLVALFAATASNAQTVLWDGEDEAITSRNEFAGWWDRGNPTLVDNPEKDGINPSDKCLKMTMTGNDFGQKHLALPFRDWRNEESGNQLNLQGNRRFSLMIKKAANENVLVELSDPTNGADNYWQKTATWYGSEGRWQKVVLDFSTNDGMNDFPGVFAITCQTGDVNEPQDVYVDNIVVEPVPMANGVALKDIADGSLTGDVVVSGSMMRGDCQNANGDWFRVDYDDFALLAQKLSASATSVNLCGVILKDPYDAFSEKVPGIKIYADEQFADNVLVGIKSLTVSASAGAIYNLSGQRVSKSGKGVFIQNGKKFIK